MMGSWWKKSFPSICMVLFRGELAGRPENYQFLEQAGITLTPLPGDAGNVWGLTLIHPEWGKALVLCPREFYRPPIDLLPFYPGLSDEDREAIRNAGTGLIVSVEAQHDNVLRDRKIALRFFNSVLGSDGLVAFDFQTQHYWTREMLADELSHNAALDVEALYSLHAMQDEHKQTYWIHSHGLREMGFFDFSIINPSPELPSDLFRSIAYSIIEGEAVLGGKMHLLQVPKKEAVLTDMKVFLRTGDPAAVALLQPDMDEGHQEKSAVLCEPSEGWLYRLFVKGQHPSRVLSHGLPKNSLLHFSNSASDLMSERACGTYSVCRRIWDEMAAFGLPLPAMAKIGYVVDGGAPNNKEHLWFMIKGFTDDAIDAVLVNQPFAISRMKEGDRAMHLIPQLSDWMILTPLGPITPRNASPARALRNLPAAALDELRTVLQQTTE